MLPENTPPRDKYLEAAQQQLEENIFYHSLAVEACMSGLYDYLSEQGRVTDNEPTKEEWQLAGLIHDIDYSGEYKDEHPNKTEEVLTKYNLPLPETVHNIIKAHAPDLTGYQPQNLAEWSIFCADSLTGLIVAVTLVYHSKKMADVKLSSIIKRFKKEPKFAAGTRRDEVQQCEKSDGLNIPIDKFIEICFDSMKRVAPQMGL